ncbi:MAG: hypothetical protein KGI37_10505 [Alphaproteobacteria bacterium]|nr:hypothetical protein [Alphaproteobacteria bacterium]
MTFEKENSDKENTDDRKPVGLGNFRPKRKIIIYEETMCGSVKRICDPAEFGIIEEASGQTVEEEKTKAARPLRAALRQDRTIKPRRPSYPTIYEEDFGGKNRRVITIDELSARFR